MTPDVCKDKEALEKVVVFDKKPEEEKILEWLIKDKGFAEIKVKNGLEKLQKSQTKKNQFRLDAFFKQSKVISSQKRIGVVAAPVKAKAGRGRGRGKK